MRFIYPNYIRVYKRLFYDGCFEFKIISITNRQQYHHQRLHYLHYSTILRF